MVLVSESTAFAHKQRINHKTERGTGKTCPLILDQDFTPQRYYSFMSWWLPKVRCTHCSHKECLIIQIPLVHPHGYHHINSENSEQHIYKVIWHIPFDSQNDIQESDRSVSFSWSGWLQQVLHRRETPTHETDLELTKCLLLRSCFQ